MLMNITNVTLPVTTQIPTCIFENCRGRIAEYVSIGWPFNTDELLDCINCPFLQNTRYDLTYSPNWLTIWLKENFVIKTSIGQDSQKNLRVGSLDFCMMQCFFDITCVAFSRQKNIGDDDKNGECWLTKNITVNQTSDDPEWYTVVFNATL